MLIDLLEQELRSAVKGDPLWDNLLRRQIFDNSASSSLHLAVLVEPYLQYIIDGLKTVESRFSAVKCAPYLSVNRDDVVLLKKSGGPIVAICQVGEIWSYRLDPVSWKFIKSNFKESLCAQDPSFWIERESKNYATLMKVSNVRTIKPVVFKKRDRRGWVVLKKSPLVKQEDLGFYE